MISRLASAGLVLATLHAPLQCGSGNGVGTPGYREDSAGDALYKLAQEFRAKGNERAAKDTLKFLVEHYPSNRHALSARAELAERSEAPASSVPSAE